VSAGAGVLFDQLPRQLLPRDASRPARMDCMTGWADSNCDIVEDVTVHRLSWEELTDEHAGHGTAGRQNIEHGTWKAAGWLPVLISGVLKPVS